MDRHQTRFELHSPVEIPDRELTALPLGRQPEGSDHVASSAEGGVSFRTRGWYEVLLEVTWDTGSTAGTRFSHTKIPGQEPLHSEAIDAGVLSAISDGQQRLRGNSLFGPGWARELVLEVWHDNGAELAVEQAALIVRDLGVPWPPQLMR